MSTFDDNVDSQVNEIPELSDVTKAINDIYNHVHHNYLESCRILADNILQNTSINYDVAERLGMSRDETKEHYESVIAPMLQCEGVYFTGLTDMASLSFSVYVHGRDDIPTVRANYLEFSNFMTPDIYQAIETYQLYRDIIPNLIAAENQASEKLGLSPNYISILEKAQVIGNRLKGDE